MISECQKVRQKVAHFTVLCLEGIMKTTVKISSPQPGLDYGMLNH
jgi:hypothetical protein